MSVPMRQRTRKQARKQLGALAVLLAWLLATLSACQRESDEQPPSTHPAPDGTSAGTPLRLATFNIAMGLNAGELSAALQHAGDLRLRQLASILQIVRPDVVLLNEFDYDPQVDAAQLLNQNYLAIAQQEHPPVNYPYHYRAAVNTGLDSGLDLDGNGKTGEPADAWGYGSFPGQYGMLLLSRYPIDTAAVRSWQLTRWASLHGARAPQMPDDPATTALNRTASSAVQTTVDRRPAAAQPYYPDEIWQKLRLSSKSHWDVPLQVHGKTLHLLAFHPTPPVFDGPEDRNGLRNFDEIRLWAQYLEVPAVAAEAPPFPPDDQSRSGRLDPAAHFVVAGDFNADPLDGDSLPGAAAQLLQHPRINAACQPGSAGARQAAAIQGGVNAQHRGDPALDTSDFNDQRSGNLRLDYLLPSVTLSIAGCGVFWPAADQPGHELIDLSDHRLVWLDITL